MFQGFYPQTVDFMWGIRFNNEKSWFEAHKEEYQTYFYGPMRELGRQVFAEVAEENQDLDLMNRVSRIYRHARRLHGQGPYKDRLLFSIERPSEDWTGDPVFWFELRPEGVTLVEIAPGIDLQTQVLDQMEFMPKIADDLKLMDERIFREELMGLAND